MAEQFVLRGLPNLGATCYLNSILQILCNIPELRFNSVVHSSNPDADANATSDAYVAWLKTHRSESAPTDTAPLRTFIVKFITYYSNFGSGMQDQHEYLMLLFKILHDCRSSPCIFKINGVKKTLIDTLEEKALQNLRKDGMWTSFNNVANDKERGWNSDIFQTFTGQLHYQTACAAADCKYVSHRFETFRSLDLDIPVKDNITLEDCLTNAIHTSQLDSDNCYECDKCQRKTRAIRKMNIWRLPSVLVICLKRFKTDYRNQQVHISKNTSKINIPPMLDMNPYLTLNLKWNLADYELFAIANHIGTPNGGHCFSYLKTPENKWFLANDTQIEALPSGCSFNGTEPYILFYRQK